MSLQDVFQAVAIRCVSIGCSDDETFAGASCAMFKFKNGKGYKSAIRIGVRHAVELINERTK